MVSGFFGPVGPLIYGFEYTEILQNIRKDGNVSKKNIVLTYLKIWELEKLKGWKGWANKHE